jgi:hypothetical protein
MRFVLLWMIAISMSLFPFVVSAGEGETLIDRQEIAVTLVPAEHLLLGESRFFFAVGGTQVTLALTPAAHIERITAAGQGVPFSFTNGTLALSLPGTQQAPVTVTIRYRVVFKDPVDEHPISSEDPTYGVNGVIGPRGTFLGSGAGWYPSPSATPRHRAVQIEAPAGTEALTAGKRVERSTVQGVSRSKWEELRPVGELSLSAGPYRIEERRVDGVDLYTYFYPDNAALSARYLDAAAKYLRFYTTLFGPYPFEKFAVVENFFPTGYGMPSYTLLGSTVIRLPFIIDTSFPHEIAHCWWGNGVQVDMRQGNWSEGLVTYLADYLLKEKSSAAEGRDYRLQILTDYAALVAPDRDFPLANFTSRVDPFSRAIGYGKGAMLFHMIRSQLGDRPFFAALREVCRERLYRAATWDDFVHAFSKSAGYDLAPFVAQWLSRPGGPQLTFAGVSLQRDGESWIVSGTVRQTPPFYALKLPLRLETVGDPVRQTLPIAGENTPFRLSLAVQPKRLLLDPDAELFRILAADEIPAIVNRLKGSKKLLAVSSKSCQVQAETFRQFLESLGQGGVEVIDEAALARNKISDHDLLFCGVPQDKRLLPRLPEGVTVSGRGFTLDGEHVSADDGFLFVVGQYPGSTGQIASLYLPLSDGAAQRYGRKISHYGKYSYLLFMDGENRRKGISQAWSAGMVVEFDASMR